MHGLIVGKFYPPHEGHHYLIDTALGECDRVTVAACYSSVENIPIEDRIAWIKDAHPTPSLRVVPVFDDTPVEYTDETWGWFLDALMKGLDSEHPWRWYNELYPDTIYTGENYGPEFAKRLNARYRSRSFQYRYPTDISVREVDRGYKGGLNATAFRKYPAQNWEWLRPATKAGLCKRVVVLGAESSGTSTLAKALGEWYETPVVPEYGRAYAEGVGLNHRWAPDEFRFIAQQQKRMEDYMARYSRNGLLICDTDEFATAMFSSVYLGKPIGKPGSVEAELVEIAQRSPADLYIITDHEGVTFEQDGTREHEDLRGWMTGWFLRNISASWASWVMVGGDQSARLIHAQNCINSLEWDIADPIEYRPRETA
jgi:HTH-type transcriptional regulator, transcriptional repressor of NAD biosynthesis genes